MTDQETKEFFKRVGERIRFVREAMEITAEEFCQRTGIRADELEKWETGLGGGMPIEHMVMLTQELHVSMDYLYSFEIEKSIPKAYLNHMMKELPEDLRSQIEKIIS